MPVKTWPTASLEVNLVHLSNSSQLNNPDVKNVTFQMLAILLAPEIVTFPHKHLHMQNCISPKTCYQEYDICQMIKLHILDTYSFQDRTHAESLERCDKS